MTAMLYTHYAGALVHPDTPDSPAADWRTGQPGRGTVSAPYWAANPLLFDRTAVPALAAGVFEPDAGQPQWAAGDPGADRLGGGGGAGADPDGRELVADGRAIRVGAGNPPTAAILESRLLLIVWLLLTPIALLALNAWVAPVYQVRYAIAMLPAGALLLAYGLRWVGFPGLFRRFHIPLNSSLLSAVIGLVLLVGFIQTQWTIYPELWPEKSPWETVIRQMVKTRQPLEPMITDFAPSSPSAYYDRQLHVRQGISLDLSWRLHTAAEIRDLMKHFEQSPSVWVALPSNTAKSWHIVAALDAGRGVGYRSSLVNMIFYRFDPGETGDLSFRFGDLVRFVDGPRANEQFSVVAGDSICVNLTFAALAPLDNVYSAGLHLVGITGAATGLQWDGGLGAAEAGERLDFEPCIDIPGGTAAGNYHLELVVYSWADSKRLPLFEDSAEPALLWGDVLMLAAVDVTD